jgi:uncharacterized protein with PhoU and TrkA domain
MSQQSQDISQELRKLESDLTQLRDEVKLKLDLASKDAKDAMGSLEPRIQQFSKDLQSAGQAAQQELVSRGRILREETARLRDRMQSGN